MGFYALYLFIYLFGVFVYAHVCHSICVEIRGQSGSVPFHHIGPENQIGCQAWHLEPFLWPHFRFSKKYLLVYKDLLCLPVHLHDRRGHQIPLSTVVSRCMVAGS